MGAIIIANGGKSMTDLEKKPVGRPKKVRDPELVKRQRITEVAQWVEDRYKTGGYKFDYGRTVFYIPTSEATMELSFEELEDDFFLESIQANFGKQRDIVKTVLRQILGRERKAYIKTITDVICAQTATEFRKKQANEQLGNLIYYMTGSRSELDIAVMRHFYWQVKRKLMGYPVVHHMMPFWYGNEQGSGKSTVIRWLVKPMKELSIEQTFDVFMDSRRTGAFEKYFVLFLDEMSAASKTDMATIKGIVTGERVGHRKLYASEEGAVRINTTLIGAANKPLYELLKDDHMRRFWQINVQAKADVVKRWGDLRALDYSLLWDCISHEDECPLLPYLAQIDIIQQDLSTNRLPMRFVEDRLDISNDVEERVTPSDLYVWFTRYCRDLGVEENRIEKERVFLLSLKDSPIQKIKTGGLVKYKCKLK